MGSEDESSNSTQENEYREDSETEVRVNLHGRKIKQRMALPTFEDEEEDEVDALTQSHATSTAKKKKKKKKKKKHRKKKERKQEEEQVIEKVDEESVQVKKNENKMEVENESHDIAINQSLNMGFDDEELMNESSQHIELTKDEVTATMNDLQMELMKENEQQEVDDNMDIVQTVEPQQKEKGVDLSFMDVMSGNNEKNEDVANEVIGNGNAPDPSDQIVEN